MCFKEEGGCSSSRHPPPTPQESKQMTVMATLDLAPDNISRKDGSQKGQGRERRNWGEGYK